MIDTLPSGVRAEIDHYLDAVETQLNAAGTPRQQRRAIADDLETQIIDMLAAVPSQPPTLADVESILSRLDRPEAYADKAEPPIVQPPAAMVEPPGRSRPSRHARWALLYIGLGLAGQILLIEAVFLVEAMLAGRFRSTRPTNDALQSPWVLVLFAVPAAITTAVIALVGPVLGTWRGWVATSRIRQSGGAEYGLRLAVLAAVFYPLLAIWGGTLVVRHWVVAAIWITTTVTTEQWVQISYITISFAVGAAMLSAAYLWIFWQLTGPPKQSSPSSNQSRWYRALVPARLLTSRR